MRSGNASITTSIRKPKSNSLRQTPRRWSRKSCKGGMRMKSKMLWCSASLLFFVGFGFTLPARAQLRASLNADANSSAPIVSGPAHLLQIAPGDLLDVEIFDTAELSGKLRVDERG